MSPVIGDRVGLWQFPDIHYNFEWEVVAEWRSNHKKHNLENVIHSESGNMDRGIKRNEIGCKMYGHIQYKTIEKTMDEMVCVRV